MPASHELLAPFDPAIHALRPGWAHPDPEVRQDVARLGWAILAETGSASQAGIWRKLEAAMHARGGVVDPADSELSRGIFDELPPWKVRALRRPGCAAPPQKHLATKPWWLCWRGRVCLGAAGDSATSASLQGS